VRTHLVQHGIDRAGLRAFEHDVFVHVSYRAVRIVEQVRVRAGHARHVSDRGEPQFRHG